MNRTLNLKTAVVVASAMLLAACLVEDKTLKSYTISLPAKIPVYQNGQYINFGYDLFTVNGVPQRASGYLQWKWEVSSLFKPFNTGILTPLMRFVVTEAPSDGENKAVQYVSQDSNGSMHLYATEGIGVAMESIQKSGYWVTTDPTLALGTDPTTNQILWSPIDDGGTTNIVGVNQADIVVNGKKITDFYLAGPCGTAFCPAAATFTFSEFTINTGGFEEVETPLGKFQAYRLDYTGVVSVIADQPQIPLFDFRMSCWKVGEQGPVSFNGSMWIYPPIGPVQIKNACIFKNVNTYYIAKVNKTNLAY